MTWRHFYGDRYFMLLWIFPSFCHHLSFEKAPKVPLSHGRKYKAYDTLDKMLYIFGLKTRSIFYCKSRLRAAVARPPKFYVILHTMRLFVVLSLCYWIAWNLRYFKEGRSSKIKVWNDLSWRNDMYGKRNEYIMPVLMTRCQFFEYSKDLLDGVVDEKIMNQRVSSFYGLYNSV